MSEYYNSYCFDKFGRYLPPTTLSSVEAIIEFCELNKGLHHQIRIVAPSDDAIIVQMIEGLYVFPDFWKQFNVMVGLYANEKG